MGGIAGIGYKDDVLALFGGLGSLGEVHETPFLVGLVRPVNLIEPVGLAFPGLVDKALAQEDGERLIAVEFLGAGLSSDPVCSAGFFSSDVAFSPEVCGFFSAFSASPAAAAIALPAAGFALK